MSNESDLAYKSEVIAAKYSAVVKRLKGLTEAARGYWSDGKRYGFRSSSWEDDFETELVKAENFLKEVK